MKKYITNKGLQNFNLFLMSNVNAIFKLYKLSISISELNKVLCVEMWPSGVFVCKGAEGEKLIGFIMKENLSQTRPYMANKRQLNCLNRLTCITYNCEYADHSRIDVIKSLYQQCDFLLLQEHGLYRSV